MDDQRTRKPLQRSNLLQHRRAEDASMLISKGPPDFPPHTVARFAREHAILDAFARVEAARAEMRAAAREMMRLIREDAEWRKQWADFIAAGGVTRVELCKWMVNQRRIRSIRRRAHLRLVSQNDD